MAAVESFLDWIYSDAVNTAADLKRDRPMEILCLGMNRTGTESLKKALLHLGYSEVYHGWDTVQRPKDWVVWRKAMKMRFDNGPKVTLEEWDSVLGHSMALSDQPAITFAPELIEAYPNAKVILTTRDVEAWHKSVTATQDAQAHNFYLILLSLFNGMSWAAGKPFYELHYKYYQGSFAKNGRRKFQEHYDMVRSIVPKERLLEMHVSEGWEPICKFLGRDVPDMPFPKGNTVDDYNIHSKEITQQMERRMFTVLGYFASIVLALVGLRYFLLRL